MGIFKEMSLEPGYYSCVPKFRDASGVGFYIRIFAPAQSGIRIWRYSDGEKSALSVDRGLAAAAEIPAVAVPSSVPTRGDDAKSIAKSTDKLTQMAQALGYSDEAQMLKQVAQSWDEQDTFNRGRLDRSGVEKGVRAFLVSTPKFQKVMEDLWAEVESGSTYFRMSKAQFYAYLGDVLAKVF
eukprot:NODE_1838_length_880_cov_417.140794_g1283_i0.p2 GENE.NODE_1838_length_880_cov_417.140794_g1283_i0~~NODE_1838_length_880_cov_417.140794_g1283_i0.p2  ORF type:complete len:190 (+),score=90.72 NODE_1838_length_880_cov_417.140794_g1283_i0:25-570(+)